MLSQGFLKCTGRVLGRRRTDDAWGAESTAVGKRLAEMNTLQANISFLLHLSPAVEDSNAWK